ncbi:MAG: hypothetical protein WD360_07970 [Nitriliruptoraceae bacterium]
MRNQRSVLIDVVAAVVLAGSLTACLPFGSATVRVADAQAQLEVLADEIVDALEFEVLSSAPFFVPRQCTRVTGQEGAFSAASVTGVLASGDFRSDLVAGLLLDAGFELQRADASVEVFGRRDGMWVTVNFEPRRGAVTVDANTGCRAL